ncbi:hypothetical protein BU17DRAFT_85869 [Hysterangium stoloniferum]|nr:hypothetical protein BU17DRAFT_85869 [Hysterangium stoloniferum]
MTTVKPGLSRLRREIMNIYFVLSGLTIEHEKSMWERRWSLGKCLYLFTRYLGLFAAIFGLSVNFSVNLTAKDQLNSYLHRNNDAFMSNNSCNAFVWWLLFSVTAAIISAQGTLNGTWFFEENIKLMLSLHIASSHSTMSGGLFSLIQDQCHLFIVTNSKALVVPASLLMMGLNMPVGSAPPFGFTGCGHASATLPRFAFGMLPPLIYETILCSLMVLKAIQNYRDGYGCSILSAMVHDSLIYFVGIFTVLFVDFTLYCFHKQEWAQFVVGREYTIPCAMGCRLLMNTMEWAEVSKSSRDTIVTPTTYYPIDRLPAHTSEVKITNVTPAVNESYGFHTTIGQ